MIRNENGILAKNSKFCEYLKNVEPHYDLSSLMLKGYEEMGKKINVLNETWNHERKMALHGSQLDAVKSALTKELSVIQESVKSFYFREITTYQFLNLNKVYSFILL